MRPLERIINGLDPDALAGLTGHLLSTINPERGARIDAVLANRTAHLAVVLENIYRPHNASAVVRSCECFGIQHMHVIESANRFEPNRNIVQGALKWITLHRYRGPEAAASCLGSLKDTGYRIAAMSPEPAAIPIAELPVDAPLALCFGSEEPGLSDTVRELADFAASVPMQGFTQSLNLSVSAGIAIERLGSRLRRSQDDWALAQAERERLRALWLAQSTPGGRSIVKRYLADNPR